MDNRVREDEKEDEEAEKYAIEIAKGISPINTKAALHFKYTHLRDDLPSDIPQDDLAIIKILRKITSFCYNS